MEHFALEPEYRPGRVRKQSRDRVSAGETVAVAADLPRKVRTPVTARDRSRLLSQKRAGTRLLAEVDRMLAVGASMKELWVNVPVEQVRDFQSRAGLLVRQELQDSAFVHFFK